MEYRHEVIDFGQSIPLRCFVHRLGYSARHWHNSLELLFVLKGNVEISVGTAKQTLEEGDVLLINSNEPHELSADDCVLSAVQIKLSLFDEKVLGNGLYFDCNSRSRPGDPGFLKLKRIIAQFVKNYASGGDGKLLRAKSLSYALLSELITYFRVERTENSQEQSQYQYQRITRIVDYINEHYSENITLQSLAGQEYLSVPYLSKFFMRMMGVNFSAYLNQLRLTHAVQELSRSTATIDAIAEANGFSNSQAFVQLFKKKYGMLPSQYRRQQHAQESKAEAKPAHFNEYTILDSHQYLDYFTAWLEDDIAPAFDDSSLPMVPTHITLNASEAGTPLTHTWRGFTSVGNARQLLDHHVQAMLSELQANVGFTYIKFHGLLSDDMHVYGLDAAGNPQYSFIYVEQALDFLLSIGLKPLIQLSFMPRLLASEPEHYIFDSTMLNSPPNDMGRWCALVEALVKHLFDRYGRTEVLSWLFTVWNEPDTPPGMFGFPSTEAFYAFYLATWQTLKRLEPSLCIGSPSIYFDPKDTGTWLRSFSAWAKENQCLPDFILMHYYGTNVTYSMVEDMSRRMGTAHIQLSNDENLLHKSVDMILAFARDVYPKDTKVYLTEWNFSPAHQDLLGDTCFRSCYVVKNILENYDRLNSMGYWLLTDQFEEYQLPAQVFHGGLGMFTYNGIKKATYYAFYLLKKLGDTLLERGDGYFFTRKDDTYQLMLYHYRHFSDLYASGETFDMTFTDRYTPFDPEVRRDYNIRLSSLPAGNWRVVEYTLNRQSGSSFDKWVEMGAQPIESAEEVELLQSLSLPMINKYTAVSTERGLSINAILEPLEVRLIIIRP